MLSLVKMKNKPHLTFLNKKLMFDLNEEYFSGTVAQVTDIDYFYNIVDPETGEETYVPENLIYLN
jgi:hypothetical protein